MARAESRDDTTVSARRACKILVPMHTGLRDVARRDGFPGICGPPPRGDGAKRALGRGAAFPGIALPAAREAAAGGPGSAERTAIPSQLAWVS